MCVSVELPLLKSLTLILSGSGAITVTGINKPGFGGVLAGSGVIHPTGSTTRLAVSSPLGRRAHLSIGGMARPQ